MSNQVLRSINLRISGLGILLYSPFAARHIRSGENYLKSHYLEPDQVLPHVYKGTLVGFGTGSPGKFILNVVSGYPPDEDLQNAEFKLRLGVQVRDQTLCFRDLDDLTEWTPECPPDQTIQLADGYYHVTVYSNSPKSGILGDNQVIRINLNPLGSMPALRYQGVPSFV